MLFKLSLKNIKKSIKDYSIYFLTLVLAVTIFYVFNSTDAQNSMLILNGSKQEIAKGLVTIIGYVSIFVSVVLGFLIIYSNNFLIKRRKKEIGLYLTLGMSKRKVSTIIVTETIIIGACSLVVGLICGIFLSQFLSIITAKLFEVNMTKYQFIFSQTALLKTILYFSIIFILVIIFSVINLSRYKLIDLINAHKKNEKIKFRNKYTIIISFILSITLISYAYHLLFNNALFYMDEETIKMLISGAFGTFFLFFSLSGFLVKLLQRIKKIYYKNLNMFILKQINNKLNTTVFSTTIISLMLLLTIGILSGSMSMANAFNKDLRDNNLTDFTMEEYTSNYIIDEQGKAVPHESLLNIEKITNDEFFKNSVKDYVVFEKYTEEGFNNEKLMTKEAIKKLKKEYGEAISFNYNVNIIKESSYKDLMRLFGKNAIDIAENEYLILCNVDLVLKSYKDAYESKSKITINNHTLTPGSDKIIVTALENYNSNVNDGVVVVSDEVLDNISQEAQNIYIVGNYNKTKDIKQLDIEFVNYVENYYSKDEGGMYLFIRTKIEMEDASIGLKVILTFVGLYLGITFAICSATILAIGQLSESSDNKDRYKVLRQLGADNKTIKKALFTQISIVFMFPLIIAIIHSIVGLKELNSIIKSIGNIDLTSNIILTSTFIIILYGGYLLLTYLCSKGIIKE